jgi:misacylated tRNA(Ala) deacylase
MTEQIHMAGIQPGYERTFDARITRRGEDHLVLDRTAFYPTGGGQEHDTGVLRFLESDGGEQEVRVVRVQKKGPEVLHFLENPLPEGIVDVRGEVDWERRYAHMRMHTAQHIVTALAFELFGRARTVGNQIHRERSRVDLGLDTLSTTDLFQLEEDANQAIGRARGVKAYEEARDSLLSRVDPERCNLDLVPAHIPLLRVVEVDETDLCPCAGTHVENTKEIGPLSILGTKSKGKGKTRVEFTLDGLGDHLQSTLQR